MEPNYLPALIGAIASIGMGLLGIAVAMVMRIFKSPKETHTELSAIVGDLSRDHHALAASNAVLSNEVKHLAENVSRLGIEVRNLWDRSPLMRPHRPARN